MKREEEKAWHINVSDKAARYVSVPVPNYLVDVVERMKDHYLVSRREVVDTNVIFHRAVQVGIDALLMMEGISLIDPEMEQMEKEMVDNGGSEADGE